MDAIQLAHSRAAAEREMLSEVIIKSSGALTQDASTGNWISGDSPADKKTKGSLTTRQIQGKETQESNLEESRTYYRISMPWDTELTANMTMTVDGVAFQIEEVLEPTMPDRVCVHANLYR